MKKEEQFKYFNYFRKGGNISVCAHKQVQVNNYQKRRQV